jgi:hypothetical protein
MFMHTRLPHSVSMPGQSVGVVQATGAGAPPVPEELAPPVPEELAPPVPEELDVDGALPAPDALDALDAELAPVLW